MYQPRCSRLLYGSDGMDGVILSLAVTVRAANHVE